MKTYENTKIIFFDIDETLYIKSEKRIPDSVIQEVLPKLKAKGIIPAIATGRCIGAFPNAIKPLLGNNGFELLVTINGQYNCSQQGIISHYPLSRERIEQAIEKLNQLGIAYGLVSNDEIAVSADIDVVKSSLFPIKADYIIEPHFYQQAPIYQLLAFFPVEKEAEVIATNLLQHDLKIVRWHSEAVDLLINEHSKAMGIKDVLSRLNLNLSEAMAFGDGLNDIEMLTSVGCGVAMGNAESHLKAVANYVTLPIEKDGILSALIELGVIE